MKNEYPNYRWGAKVTIEDIEKSLNEEDKTDLTRFLDYCSTTAGERKIKDIKVSILQFRDVTEKPFKDVTLDDVVLWLKLLKQSNRTKYTTNGLKCHVKKFIRWRFKDWSEKFNGLTIVKLSPNAFNEEKINENNLITEEELKKLIEACNDYQEKSIIQILYEAGIRPQELREARWRDFSFNEEGLSTLQVYSGKTEKSRKVFFKDGGVYLSAWKQITAHNKKDDYVFPSPKDITKPIGKNWLCYRLIRISERAKLGRKLYPYLFRHTLANKIYNNAQTSYIAPKFLGHGKDMSKVYSHTSTEDVKKALEVMNGVKELSPERKHKLEREIESLKENLNKLMAVTGFNETTLSRAFFKHASKQISQEEMNKEIEAEIK